jgi:hypothetical protein
LGPKEKPYRQRNGRVIHRVFATKTFLNIAQHLQIIICDLGGRFSASKPNDVDILSLFADWPQNACIPAGNHLMLVGRELKQGPTKSRNQGEG